MFNVTYSFVDGRSKQGSEITSEHFGVNSLAHRANYGANSYFDDVVAAVGANVIRYTGGTVSEQYFFLDTPNNNGTNLAGITKFLDFCAATDSKAIIVLPTGRYFDDTTRGLADTAQVEIETFVKNLVTHYFETNGTTNPAEIAEIVCGVLDEWCTGDSPDIFVQAG